MPIWWGNGCKIRGVLLWLGEKCHSTSLVSRSAERGIKGEKKTEANEVMKLLK